MEELTEYILINEGNEDLVGFSVAADPEAVEFSKEGWIVAELVPVSKGPILLPSKLLLEYGNKPVLTGPIPVPLGAGSPAELPPVPDGPTPFLPELPVG